MGCARVLGRPRIRAILTVMYWLALAFSGEFSMRKRIAGSAATDAVYATQRRACDAAYEAGYDADCPLWDMVRSAPVAE